MRVLISGQGAGSVVVQRFNQSLQSFYMWRECAKKMRGAGFGNEQCGKVFHLDRVDQVCLVFHIHPDKACVREFDLQGIKLQLVFAAGAAPLGAQAGHQQGLLGSGRRRLHGRMIAETGGVKMLTHNLARREGIV